MTTCGATPWTYLILRMLSQQSERHRRMCIGLGDSRRDVHAEHTCRFEAAMRRADARAALALENHIGTTLAMVRNAPPDTLPL
ncbi:hypothetical protein [Burkholderia territorii]|uniref:hypothetical protein n=1 Tax=Burkholderia territorii TaxID=1503055 RepID=UPI000B1FF6F6|nr:hypothetical protein [Burkholderia territorii]